MILEALLLNLFILKALSLPLLMDNLRTRKPRNASLTTGFDIPNPNIPDFDAIKKGAGKGVLPVGVTLQIPIPKVTTILSTSTTVYATTTSVSITKAATTTTKSSSYPAVTSTSIHAPLQTRPAAPSSTAIVSSNAASSSTETTFKTTSTIVTEPTIVPQIPAPSFSTSSQPIATGIAHPENPNIGPDPGVFPQLPRNPSMLPRLPSLPNIPPRQDPLPSPIGNPVVNPGNVSIPSPQIGLTPVNGPLQGPPILKFAPAINNANRRLARPTILNTPKAASLTDGDRLGRSPLGNPWTRPIIPPLGSGFLYTPKPWLQRPSLLSQKPIFLRH